MKCPKCGYLGYEDSDRCRNCKYEFALSPTMRQDLELRPAPEPRPLEDLDLIDSAMQASASNGSVDASLTADVASVPAELPLFGADDGDDTPLITRPSPPRPPLSVRRATPEVPRLRAETRMSPTPEKGTLTPPRRPVTVDVPPRTATPDISDPRPVSAAIDDTPPPSLRLTAAAIDVAILLFIDLALVYFALKICRLSYAEWPLLPKIPLVAFLLLQNIGYLVVFTAAGQTLGKMFTKLRVVTVDRAAAPDFGRAAIRAGLWLVLAVPAGLGLLPALFSRDGRGLHDLAAGTRVVRAHS